MRVLVACEFSGTVRDAFIARGHGAWSCDLLPTESPGPHIHGDVLDGLYESNWDLMIAHPPCTYLTCSAEWAYGPGPYHQKVKPETLVGEARQEARRQAIELVKMLWRAPIEKVVIENPVGVLTRHIGPYSQLIQPYQFGHNASKATCLWIRGLPVLQPTYTVAPRLVDGKPRWANQTDSGQNRLSPSEDRWKERSKTYEGIARAMAEQWG